jgi:hypothetical protein
MEKVMTGRGKAGIKLFFHSFPNNITVSALPTCTLTMHRNITKI